VHVQAIGAAIDLGRANFDEMEEGLVEARRDVRGGAEPAALLVSGIPPFSTA
jgi:hypothetical protein